MLRRGNQIAQQSKRPTATEIEDRGRDGATYLDGMRLRCYNFIDRMALWLRDQRVAEKKKKTRKQSDRKGEK
jgi:hypothetical protein